MSNIKVAIRIRPMCHREVNLNLKNIVSITPEKKISVINAKVPENNAGDSRERVKQFSFDYCFGENSTQREVFEQLGDSIIQSVISKYNVCVLAYGQSATGKTYTMMGNENDPGLTPRLCQQLFKTIEKNTQETFKISISFLEIYNERVQDLLCDQNKIGKLLRVREHPKKGPYVEGLKELSVDNVTELLHWIKSGESLRRVASTLSNKCSSRSHSVLTISCRVYSNSSVNNYSPNRHHTLSQIHLVDLAGSERASSVQNSTCRLKEGANINRSLVALGNVISALADNTSSHGSRFVPYRDSILTWLLKETLGGNSNTFMIATISPSSSCYSETVNTLRFGQRAKHIINEPLINEDPTSRIIRELREEIAYLKSLLQNHNNGESNMGSILQQIKPQRNTQSETTPSQSNSSNNSNIELAEISQEIPTTSTPPLETHPKKSNSPEHLKVPLSDNSLRRTYSAAEIQRKQDTKLSNRYTSHEALIENSPSNEETFEISKPETQIPSENDSQASLLDTQKSNAIKDAIKTHKQSKRSEIIASVSERLYSQGTHRNNSRSSSSSVMSDLSTNARNRLQQISLKALSASRRAKRQQAHVGTQTNLLKTIRVREIGIDTQNDINTILQLTKDISIETSLPNSTQNVAVGSDNILLFDKTIETFTNKPAFKLTRSCGNITDDLALLDNDDDNFKSNSLTTSNKLKSNISFTKYITNTQTQTLSNENIILFNLNSNKTRNKTTNVNIINLNCSNQFEYSSADESISDDSLDGNINLPSKYHTTPDLLNNHNNTLEATKQLRINYALQFGNIEYFEIVSEQVCSNEYHLHYAIVTYEKCREQAIVNIIQTYRIEYCTAEIKTERIPMEKVQIFKDYSLQSPVQVEKNFDEQISLPRHEYSSNCCCKTNQQIDNQLFTASAMNFISEATYYLSTLSEKISNNKCQCKSSDIAVQTNTALDFEMQTSTSFIMPINRWELPLEDSCNSLETTLRNMDEHDIIRSSRTPYSNHRRTLSSPRLYLQELQSLRRQLVEETRRNTQKISQE